MKIEPLPAPIAEEESKDVVSVDVSRAGLRLVAQMLDMSADKFSTAGCNDFDLLAAFDGDAGRARAFAIGYHAWRHNKTRATLCIGESVKAHFDPDMYDVFEADLLNIGDYEIMGYLAAMFDRVADEGEGRTS